MRVRCSEAVVTTEEWLKREKKKKEVRHFFQLSELDHFCSYVTNGSSYQKPTLSTRGIY